MSTLPRARLSNVHLLPLLFALLNCCASAGALPRERRLVEEPFDSFRLIDSKLSELQTQFTEVQRGLQMGWPAETKHWADEVHAAARTASSIEEIARKLKVRYLRRHRRYGTRIFRLLELRASATRHQMALLGRSSGKAEKTRAADNAAAALLKLIYQYQAVSAGYENSHCNRGKIACCVPRKSSGSGSSGCKWECVQSRARCKSGFPADPLKRVR